MSELKSTIGIYAGSFSPFHIGHLDIVRQSQEIFEEVLVAKSVNPDKQIKEVVTRFPLPEKFLNYMGVMTATYDTLLTNFVATWEETWNVTLIRGLRSGADLNYEQNLIAFLRGINPRIKAVYLLCDPRYQHISSSALLGIREFSEEEFKKYVISN
jgi:pantetheine-phosphate adenylyltransferase